MKRLFAILIALAVCLSFAGCESDSERADNLAQGFISALLIRDEAEMEKYLHPDFVASAMPNDEFYKKLEEQFFEIGHELTALSAVSKGKLDDDYGLRGDALKCTYIARVNELIYTVELVVLENDNGYGIISAAMVLNIDLDYYYGG